MTFADLQRMKRVSDPQISPSGKWVMFSVTDVDLEKNTKVNHLWVVPMGIGRFQWARCRVQRSGRLRSGRRGSREEGFRRMGGRCCLCRRMGGRRRRSIWRRGMRRTGRWGRRSN